MSTVKIASRYVIAGLCIIGVVMLAGWRWNGADRTYLQPGYDFPLAVAQGAVEGHRKERKFGENPSVGTSYEALWEAGGDGVFPVAAQTLGVVSTDANDDDGDTGARTVLLQGLDSDLVEIQELVTMNGTSEVVTTATFLRLNRAFVVSNGTYGGTNEGDITIDQTTSGDVMGKITAGLGQTQKAIYTVPAGYTAYNTKLIFSTDANKSADFQVIIRALDSDPTTAPFTPWRQIAFQPGVKGEVITGDGYTAIPAGTDVEIRAKAASGSPSCSASAQFYLIAD
jgi:hypothetical protein